MQTSNVFPFHLHWSADELASAMPLRLSELSLFDGTALDDSANVHRHRGAALPRAAAHRIRLQGYAASPARDGLFRIG